MGAIKITKVIDSIGDYHILSGEGKSWWNLVFISLGGQFSSRYALPMAARHTVQSSLEAQDGVSFVFKMESAWPAPFLPQ